MSGNDVDFVPVLCGQHVHPPEIPAGHSVAQTLAASSQSHAARCADAKRLGAEREENRRVGIDLEQHQRGEN